MTVVVVGVIADRLGGVAQWETIHANHPGRNFDVRRKYSSMPSTEYRSVHAADIPVDVDHDRPIGRVAYLERSASKLFAVCEIDASTLSEGPWYFSPEVLHRGGREIELRALAVTKRPASVGLGPIDPFPGTLADVSRTIVYQDGWVGQVVKRAHEYDRKRKRGEPIRVHETGKPAAPPTSALTVPPPGRIEYRSAQPISVNPRHRLIELLAVPYGVDATVNIRGRTVTESFSNTAFIGEQPKRILATRDHDMSRLVGKVTNLEPFHREGLIATIQAADTPLGRESVELARDQILDASIGFQIPDGGEHWQDHSRRRVTKALLREISLVPEPAYPTRVIDVRDSDRYAATR